MNRIRDLRIARGWRQKDLAEAMHTTHQSIARYEAGERGLDVDMICTLCDIFGVTADYLLCRSDNPQPALLDAVRGCEIFPFVALCLYTGLRREEALGLRWRNVTLDGDAPHLDVRDACTWEGRNLPKLSQLLKSDAAYRTIPLPPALVQILRDLKAARPGEYVISRGEGELLSATAFRRRWAAVTIREERTVRINKKDRDLRLGDPVPYHPGVTVCLDFHTTPHLLRHTYISELILSGVPVRRVQYLAGHASPVQTLKIYTHLMENRPEDLYDEVLKAFPG